MTVVPNHGSGHGAGGGPAAEEALEWLALFDFSEASTYVAPRYSALEYKGGPWVDPTPSLTKVEVVGGLFSTVNGLTVVSTNNSQTTTRVASDSQGFGWGGEVVLVAKIDAPLSAVGGYALLFVGNAEYTGLSTIPVAGDQHLAVITSYTTHANGILRLTDYVVDDQPHCYHLRCDDGDVRVWVDGVEAPWLEEASSHTGATVPWTPENLPAQLLVPTFDGSGALHADGGFSGWFPDHSVALDNNYPGWVALFGYCNNRGDAQHATEAAALLGPYLP